MSRIGLIVIAICIVCGYIAWNVSGNTKYESENKHKPLNELIDQRNK